MVLVVLAIVAGGGLLATWDIPAPTTAVDQSIENREGHIWIAMDAKGDDRVN